MTQDNRISPRYPTRLAVLACTRVESRRSMLVDISRHGAKIEIDRPFAPGDAIVIEYDGEPVTASVTWVEVDRMGVRFAEPLTEGPLLDALNAAARVSSFQRVAPATPGGTRSFGRRAD